MEGTKVRKFKVFPAWQDDKEESWLQAMAQQGLHLTQPLFPCVYTFVRGAPADVAYRFDYVPRMSRDEFEVYLQVFRDAGWEYLGQMAGWHYFRKPVRPGEAPEIFTDAASKIRKYRRLLGYLVVVVMPLFVIWVTRSDERPQTVFFDAVGVFQFVVLVLMAYGLARIALRIRQLHRL
ncbi:MAG: hypothetical protein A2Y93_09090 [Chloroflexi bacterium RBG_13_68_17]|nr:MAG: hypothetical protein A2Y93_09090 [Chloroflexi bacterium RBG_13_68_17]